MDRNLIVAGTCMRPWEPNEMQLDIGRAVLSDGAKSVMGRGGRKSGKTESISDLLVRQARARAGSYYYITPYQKMAREILWEPRRLQERILPEWYDRVVISEDNQGMRLVIRSVDGGRSFIKLDGSDNYVEWEGINPDGLVLDEFRIFRPQFFSVMNPNRASKDAWCVIVGSTPETERDPETGDVWQYWQVWDEWSELAKEDPRYRVFHYHSTVNKTLLPWFEREKARLIKAGREKEWQVRYEAARVDWHDEQIFPPGVWDRERLVKPYGDVQERVWNLLRTPGRCDCLVVTDPASSKKNAWAVLFLVLDWWERKVLVVDGIHERDRTRMTVGHMWPAMKTRAEHVFGGSDYTVVYDTGARWFLNEVLGLDPFAPAMQAAKKEFRAIGDGVALIVDMFQRGLVQISDSAEGLITEIEGFTKERMQNRKGGGKDDALDCFRYGLDYWGFTLSEGEHPEREEAKFMSQEAQQHVRDEREMEGIGEEFIEQEWNILDI